MADDQYYPPLPKGKKTGSGKKYTDDDLIDVSKFGLPPGITKIPPEELARVLAKAGVKSTTVAGHPDWPTETGPNPGDKPQLKYTGNRFRLPADSGPDTEKGYLTNPSYWWQALNEPVQHMGEKGGKAFDEWITDNHKVGADDWRNYVGAFGETFGQGLDTGLTSPLAIGTGIGSAAAHALGGGVGTAVNVANKGLGLSQIAHGIEQAKEGEGWQEKINAIPQIVLGAMALRGHDYGAARSPREVLSKAKDAVLNPPRTPAPLGPEPVQPPSAFTQADLPVDEAPPLQVPDENKPVRTPSSLTQEFNTRMPLTQGEGGRGWTTPTGEQLSQAFTEALPNPLARASSADIPGVDINPIDELRRNPQQLSMFPRGNRPGEPFVAPNEPTQPWLRQKVYFGGEGDTPPTAFRPNPNQPLGHGGPLFTQPSSPELPFPPPEPTPTPEPTQPQAQEQLPAQVPTEQPPVQQATQSQQVAQQPQVNDALTVARQALDRYGAAVRRGVGIQQPHEYAFQAHEALQWAKENLTPADRGQYDELVNRLEQAMPDQRSIAGLRAGLPLTQPQIPSPEFSSFNNPRTGLPREFGEHASTTPDFPERPPQYGNIERNPAFSPSYTGPQVPPPELAAPNIPEPTPIQEPNIPEPTTPPIGAEPTQPMLDLITGKKNEISERPPDHLSDVPQDLLQKLRESLDRDRQRVSSLGRGEPPETVGGMGRTEPGISGTMGEVINFPEQPNEEFESYLKDIASSPEQRGERGWPEVFSHPSIQSARSLINKIKTVGDASHYAKLLDQYLEEAHENGNRAQKAVYSHLLEDLAKRVETMSPSSERGRQLEFPKPIAEAPSRAKIENEMYSKLFNNPDENSHFEAMEWFTNEILNETDPEVIKDNYNNWEQESKMTEIGKDKDAKETAWILRNHALDRYQQIGGKSWADEAASSSSTIPTLYHGTRLPLDSLDPSMRQSHGLFSEMNILTENPEYANFYAEGEHPEFGKRELRPNAGNQPNVIPVKINPKNVLDLTQPISDKDVAELQKMFPTAFPNNYRNNHFVFSMLKNARLGEMPWDAIKFTEHGQTNWAVPKGTELKTPSGVPLNPKPEGTSGRIPAIAAKILQEPKQGGLIGTSGTEPPNRPPTGEELTKLMNQRIKAGGGKPPNKPPNKPPVMGGFEEPSNEPEVPKEASPEQIKQIQKDIPQKEIPNRMANIITHLTDDTVKQLDPTEQEHIVRQALNFQRTLVTSFDLSMPMRQGLGLAYRPEWWKAWGPMIKAFGDENAYKNVMDSIENDPSGLFVKNMDAYGNEGEGYSAATRAGLALVDTLGSGAQNEFFRSIKAEQMLKPVRMSKRAADAFLNKLRADTFKNFVKAAGAENDLVTQKKIANFINVSTGHGRLGAFEPSAKAMADVFFSPRYQASRVQMVTRVFDPRTYSDMPPTMRYEALKSLAMIVGTGLAMGQLARANGAQVESDPTSTDFGKIRYKETRIDPFTGLQQYAVAMSRIISGDETTPSKTFGQPGTVHDLTSGKFGRSTRADVAQRFITGKLAPVPGFVWAWMQGKDFDNVDFTVKHALYNRMVPIVAQDLIDIYNNDPGLIPSMAGAAGAITGVGVQTYGR